MFVKIIKTSFILSSLCLMTACTTSHSQGEDPEQKKINTAQINTELGLAYLQRHEMQHAKQKLLLALEEAPNSPEPWYAMGYFMESTGDIAEAKTYYLKSVALAPKKGDVQNNFGTYLCRTGDYSGAIQHFMLALDDPEYLETASAYENAGLCALKIPDKTLALNYFNKAIMQDPNHTVALIESAQLDYDMKNYREAKIRLDEFLAISTPNEQSRMLSSMLGGDKSSLLPYNGVA